MLNTLQQRDFPPTNRGYGHVLVITFPLPSSHAVDPPAAKIRRPTRTKPSSHVRIEWVKVLYDTVVL